MLKIIRKLQELNVEVSIKFYNVFGKTCCVRFECRVPLTERDDISFFVDNAGKSVKKTFHIVLEEFKKRLIELSQRVDSDYIRKLLSIL